jgi:hypothetical protein
LPSLSRVASDESWNLANIVSDVAQSLATDVTSEKAELSLDIAHRSSPIAFSVRGPVQSNFDRFFKDEKLGKIFENFEKSGKTLHVRKTSLDALYRLV